MLGLLFIAVISLAGLAKADPAKRGPAAVHSQYLCVSNNLQLFRISRRGTLESIPVSFADSLPLPQTDNVDELLPDPHSHSLYVSWIMTYNQGSAIVSDIDRMRVSQQGKLFSVFHQELALNSAVNRPRAFALGEHGRLLLVVFASGTLSKAFLRAYHIQPHGPLHPFPKPVILYNNFQSITTDPAGRFAYVTSANDSHIYQYAISLNAGLSPLAVPAVSTAAQPMSITFHPSGHFAYVTSQGGNVTLYRVENNGQLSLSASYFFGKNKPALNLAIAPNGRFLYACLPRGNTFQYHIRANGTLQPLAPKAIPFGGYKIIVDLTSRFAYSLSTRVIYQYRIQSDGTLQPLIPGFVSRIGTPVTMAIIQN